MSLNMFHPSRYPAPAEWQLFQFHARYNVMKQLAWVYDDVSSPRGTKPTHPLRNVITGVELMDFNLKIQSLKAGVLTNINS